MLNNYKFIKKPFIFYSWCLLIKLTLKDNFQKILIKYNKSKDKNLKEIFLKLNKNIWKESILNLIINCEISVTVSYSQN